jgi:hypothetical protein
MTIKRIASLVAVTAAIAAVPAAAPSTFASIAPTAAFAGCSLDGAPIDCEPGPGDSCEPNCDPGHKRCGSESTLVSRYDCDLPLTDVPREEVPSQTIPTRTYARERR